MVFSTHCWKKFDLPVWLLAPILLLSAASGALADGIEVRTAELVAAEESWQLNADFDIGFSADVEEALSKGVPLNFLIEFELVAPRRYWFDDEIASASQRVRLSYHALSRQYLINVGPHQKSFASLQEVREELGKLRGWPVVEKSQVKKGETYHALLRMRLDHSSLPKALQVDAMGSEKWKLVSDRYGWTPALTNTPANTESPVPAAK
ncbi:MAG: DUF4390 domain-containing protein [Nitrosomonadales bacterium]|nr:MAG: DUF4390 domain-containing protein [Nitrosomonadales bacterium]